MAQQTQSTEAFSAEQKDRAASALAGAEQLITDLGFASEIQVFQEVVQVRLNFKQPAGATWDEATFQANLQALKLIP